MPVSRMGKSHTTTVGPVKDPGWHVNRVRPVRYPDMMEMSPAASPEDNSTGIDGCTTRARDDIPKKNVCGRIALLDLNSLEGYENKQYFQLRISDLRSAYRFIIR